MIAQDRQSRTAGKLTRSVLARSVLVGLLMAAVFWVFYTQQTQAPSGVLSIDSISFLADVGDGPPAPEDFPRERRALPDDWLQTATDVSAGWYAATVEFGAGREEAWGVYLPVIHLNAEVFLNGRLIGRTTQFVDADSYGDPFAREVNRPIYFLLPDELPAAGSNILLMHVKSKQPGNGLLGPVYIGPDRILKSAYEKRFAARITTVQIITAGMLVIAMFMSVQWFLRREDSVYGWFALLAYAWAVHNAFFLDLDTPLSAAAEDWVTLVMLGWFIAFMVLTTHRYLDLRLIRLERITLGVTALGSLVMALPLIDSLAWSQLAAHRIWSTFFLAVPGSYCLGRIALAYRWRDDLKNPLVLPAGLAIFLLGIHDWLVVMGLWPRDAGLFLHYGAPVALIVFGSLLLERLAGVLRDAESLNLELEQRVTEKHDELEANYQKLRGLENRQILADERERFMQEMHDGVGGHLISMLSMMRGGEKNPNRITRAIEATLSDLRIMIDSLDPNEHDIPALLGAMRARLEPQLASSRLRFEWQVSEIPPIPGFGPRQALQVMRILQEAITNIINHAEAHMIRIKACVDIDADGKKSAILDVIDDGKGFSPDARRGHGLDNMEQRATSIGALLEIAPANPGTRVRLIIRY